MLSCNYKYMNVIFNINYQTGENQKLYVVGSIPELGEWQAAKAKEMACNGDGTWTVSIETSTREITYRYLIIGNGETINEPWNRIHSVQLDSSRAVCYLYDYWQLVPPNIALYTSAFTKNVFARQDSAQYAKNAEKQLIIRTLCPRVKKNQKLFLSGNQESLGCWNPESAKEMSCVHFPEWEIRLNADKITFPLEYKFIIADETRQCCRWETGENRFLSNLPENRDATFILSEYPFRDSLPAWKGAGTVIPVFSLRSERSFGVGDMYDLKLLIDWAKQTNQCLIQVLPINDTTATHTWTDSYPYSAISIYALHPIYISLSDMGALKDDAQVSIYQRKQRKLNKNKEIDYEEVVKHKQRYCRAYFEQEKTQILKSKAFQAFCRDNRTWLEPYAAFCYYRDKYHTADFSKWKKNSEYQPLQVQDLCKKTSVAWSEISFIYFLQFVLHTQFRAVSDYAREKGVILKGDLPIGISRTGVEAWMEPAYFNSEQQAGAPPDFFSATGQNWSFPTYNWERMEKDGYTWWKKRFRKLSDYFDCLRIDHILGFFRIWEVPFDYVQGLCGHFRPALPMSVEEIHAYGFVFDKRYVKPRIQRRFLIDLFDTKADEVATRYLTPDAYGSLELLPYCDTQRKIHQLFSDAVDEDALLIRDGLCKIANEALFLEDPYEQDKYHPRILASQSFAFQGLTEHEQAALIKLSDDFFYERHTGFWKSVALKRLTPLVNCTEMLICGEDLGMIPKSVQEVMDELHILSLELERIPKAIGVDFTNLRTVPYLSVCTTSTHDMKPLRNWWEEDTQTTQQYYNSVLNKEGKVPTNCTADLAKQIILNHLNASSILTIIPLQDWFALSDTLKQTKDIESERINIPENPRHYWCYRMHCSLEQLLSANELNQKISEMIDNSGR